MDVSTTQCDSWLTILFHVTYASTQWTNNPLTLHYKSIIPPCTCFYYFTARPFFVTNHAIMWGNLIECGAYMQCHSMIAYLKHFKLKSLYYFQTHDMPKWMHFISLMWFWCSDSISAVHVGINDTQMIHSCSSPYFCDNGPLMYTWKKMYEGSVCIGRMTNKCGLSSLVQ